MEIVLLPEFIVLENLAAEVREINIKSCLKWKGAAYTGLKLPLPKVWGIKD
jgi:hypothetical protein